LYRASVVKIDQVGGVLDPTPPNPKNSIQARVITNARDKDLEDDELPVFWPLFPHDIMPVKPGEHVYVIFEDAAEKTHGLWLCRIPEPSSVDNANIVPGIQKYQNDTANDFSSVGAEQAVQDTDSPPTAAPVSSEFVSETVPKFRARVGDRVIEGSNNTIIILSRDRPTDPASGLPGAAAGTIDIVAGRAAPDNLDMAGDKSRIYITMKSDIDANLGTGAIGPAGVQPSAAVAAIAVKSDEIRVVARTGTRIIVEGGDLILEGANIIIGNQAVEPAVLGTALETYLKTVVVNTPAGPGTLTPPPPTILSQTVKVKA